MNRSTGSSGEVIQLVRSLRLIAVIRLDDLTQAVEISKALLDGGIRVQEYTLSNPKALEAVRLVREAVPEFSTSDAALGVGSIRHSRQVTAAQQSGADFIVTPTFDRHVVDTCQQACLPLICGALTPTEIALAAAAGASMVKVFPARCFGPGYIRDLLAPMPDLSLVPTGGITKDNLQAFLQNGADAVGIGGNLIDAEALHASNWHRIREDASEYARLAAA